MRNLFVFGIAAVCAVLIAGNALATEKNGGGYGDKPKDDGKDTKKYTCYVHNYDYHYDMAVWIKEKNHYGGGHMTYGDLHKQSIHVSAKGKGHKKGYKKGYYECWLFYSHDIYGHDYGYVNEYELKGKKIAKKDIHIHNKDYHLYCDKGGYVSGY